VLALPRGGVPVAHVVARALSAPLDVFLVRKLGVPRAGDGGDRVRRCPRS
jgi:predicted phosphoribosyltransferase